MNKNLEEKIMTYAEDTVKFVEANPEYAEEAIDRIKNIAYALAERLLEDERKKHDIDSWGK